MTLSSKFDRKLIPCAKDLKRLEDLILFSAKDLCPTSVDQLPAPKKVVKAKRGDVDDAPRPKPKQDVRIADQIAIRSIVLGTNINKIGGGSGVASPMGPGVRSPPLGSGSKSPAFVASPGSGSKGGSERARSVEL